MRHEGDESNRYSTKETRCRRACKYVIFDLDDTLCDYKKAKSNAITHLNKVLKGKGIDSQRFWEDYENLEPILWRQFLDKEVTKEEYRTRRFAEPLSHVSDVPKELACELNQIYMEDANHVITLFDDVIPLFAFLKERGIVPVISTSGPSDGQRGKISALSLEKATRHIYISDEIGVAKPSPRAFEIILQDLHAHPDEVVMVGDSLEDDIEGAEKAGIRAILLDREQKYPRYTGEKIENLQELVVLL
ncbi:MAG: HAD family hydrolase [Theionarchaea archaeon]|nr:HAD family hydrolase [Theionarchaea archaeon]